MKALHESIRSDYRYLFVTIVSISVLCGFVFEKILFQLSGNPSELVLTEYQSYAHEYELIKSELFRYLLNSEMKKYILLLGLSYTIAGIFCDTLLCYITVYRYVFFLAAIYRFELGSRYVLCIAVGVIGLLLCIPVFLYCFKVSYKSYFACMENHTKLCRCTKYQLQTNIKMGIIIILYCVLGIVVETFICTDLFMQIFI